MAKLYTPSGLYDEYMSIFAVVFQDFKLFSFSPGLNVAASVKHDRAYAKVCLEKAGFGVACKKCQKNLAPAFIRILRKPVSKFLARKRRRSPLQEHCTKLFLMSQPPLLSRLQNTKCIPNLTKLLTIKLPCISVIGVPLIGSAIKSLCLITDRSCNKTAMTSLLQTKLGNTMRFGMPKRNIMLDKLL